MAKEIREANLKPQNKEIIADRVVKFIGSWRFLVSQTCAMAVWVCLNTVTPYKIDPFPFILLNLLLSTQAALLGPLILMSSNNQDKIDRKLNEDHYKLDLEESKNIAKISEAVEELADRIGK